MTPASCLFHLPIMLWRTFQDKINSIANGTNSKTCNELHAATQQQPCVAGPFVFQDGAYARTAYNSSLLLDHGIPNFQLSSELSSSHSSPPAVSTFTEGSSFTFLNVHKLVRGYSGHHKSEESR